jgi:hypothetical protein
MGASLVRYLMMNYFFPDLKKDRKKQNLLKNLFLLDMQFNLSTGKVTQSTKKLNNKKYVVSDTSDFILIRLK